MIHLRNFFIFDPQMRASLNAELAEAAYDPTLQPLLHTGHTALLPRYAHCYAGLRRLPRKVRRQLQRQWRRSLAGVALLMALGQAPALATTISVNITNPNIVADGRCSLIEAIDNANDTATGSVHSDCTAGNPSGADTIRLPPNSRHVLTAVNNTAFGNNGLPRITSPLTIEGRSSTITRKSTAPEFRIFFVAHHLTLNETTVSGGRSEDEGGGAFVFGSRGSASLTLNNSTISGNNSSRPGGGVSVEDGNTLKLYNSAISGNSASFGGGVSLGYDSDVILFNSAITGNKALGGGGIFGFDEGTLTVINSTISGNSATGSGGGILVSDLFSDIRLINTTISGNTAGGNGGGIDHSGCYGHLYLDNSTISGNSASNRGGGVYNDCGTTFTHTLISGNTASNGPEVYNSASIYANNFNLFGHNGNSGVVGFTPGPTDLVPSESVAQILSPLARNGGPTLTHALPPTSPAVDASPDDDDCEATDQRGVIRPQDGDNAGDVTCDIGAFELEAIPKFIYGVQDTDASKSQLFTINKTTFAVARLGPGRNGRDIEGLDIHPRTQVLYGAAGAANTFRQKGFLFSIDKVTSALTPIGPTGFTSIEALSFRPTDASLWGWAEGKGLVKISLVNGAATLVLASDKGVEGLAWNNSGQVLYASAGSNLFRYTPSTNTLTQIASNLPGISEALEIRPDGLLAVGVDGATSIKAYDPIAKQPVPAKDIPTGFNDVEGIAWPPDAP